MSWSYSVREMPENILFDGDRVWLVDWQAAFANDRYFDLKVVANFLVRVVAARDRGAGRLLPMGE